MGRDGGTQMWCATCKRVRVCAAVYATDHARGHLLVSTAHGDVNYRVRMRECLSCFSTWETCEIPRTLVEELMELRDVLGDLRPIVNAMHSDAAKLAYRIRQVDRG